MHFICKILVTVMNFLTQRKDAHRTSLVVEWMEICLPMCGKQARSLVQEDSTCPEQQTSFTTTTKPTL